MDAVVFPALSGILDVGVEGIVDAIVSADQAHLVAPHRQCQGGLQQLLQGLMERCFIDHHVALQATQVTRPAAQGLDFPPRFREADHVGQDLFLLPFVPEGLLVDVGLCQLVESTGEQSTGGDVLQRHLLLAADVEGVAATSAPRLGGIDHVAPGLGPGQAGTAGLLRDHDLARPRTSAAGTAGRRAHWPAGLRRFPAARRRRAAPSPRPGRSYAGH